VDRPRCAFEHVSGHDELGGVAAFVLWRSYEYCCVLWVFVYFRGAVNCGGKSQEGLEEGLEEMHFVVLDGRTARGAQEGG
jgi:hypothetical protein